MSKIRLYVGNIPFSASTEDLKATITDAGYTVTDAKLIIDRETNKPRGFGFVEVEADDAEGVARELDGLEMLGRTLKVNVAREREKNSGGGGHGRDRGRGRDRDQRRAENDEYAKSWNRR